MGHEIFISYSRKDQAFVHKLYGKLRRAGLHVWGDWEGLPLSGDWWKEVESRIERATLFICVISPDSIASRLCNQEISHALAYNKRIIPILHHEPEEPYPLLDHLHWIFFRETDDFEAAFETLMKSIRSALSWEKDLYLSGHANGQWKSG